MVSGHACNVAGRTVTWVAMDMRRQVTEVKMLGLSITLVPRGRRAECAACLNPIPAGTPHVLIRHGVWRRRRYHLPCVRMAVARASRWLAAWEVE